jgi:hypothetical protein
MDARYEPVRIGKETDHWLSASAGDQHSLGIRARVVGGVDGELLAWGDNALGQLGMGDQKGRTSPTVVGTGTWRAVSAGVLASAGIDSAGKVSTWGFGESGKLGHGTVGELVLSPRRVTAVEKETFQTVSYGRSHVVALTTGGGMYTWGNNVHAQCGTLDTNQYVPRFIAPYDSRIRWVHAVGGNAQTFLASNAMTVAAVGYAGQGELGLGFLKSTWLLAMGYATPKARFEMLMAPPTEVRAGADGSVAVAVGLVQPPGFTNLEAVWTADGGPISAFGGLSQTLTAQTEPGLTLPDGSRVVVYVVIFPPGPDVTRVPKEVGVMVRGTMPAHRLGLSQAVEFPFPPILVR